MNNVQIAVNYNLFRQEIPGIIVPLRNLVLVFRTNDWRFSPRNDITI